MTMTSIFSSLMDSITTESFAWWFSRATLIAAMACAYLALARRARSALRHAVAVASLVAVAVLPMASAVLPKLSLPVLPASPEAPVVAPTPRPTPFAIDRPVTDVVPATPPSAVAPVAPVRVQPTPAPQARERRASIGSVLLSTARSSVEALDWRELAFLTWLTGAMCLLAWTGLGAIGARRLSRRAPSITDETILQDCERAQRVLGLRRTVDVGVSRDVAIPMVVGALRPRVVIPASAAAWSSDRLRVVLLHELAHVQRRDCFWMRVARVVTAILWFHPLVWILSTYVRREAERACDEVVLASGIRGSDYAEHLVAIARTAATRDPLAGSALAFATRSTLERRVVAILATRLPRATTSRRTAAAVACAALALFTTIAAVQPTAVESARTAPAASFMTVEVPAAPLDEVMQVAVEPTYEINTAVNRDVEERMNTEYYLADNDKDGHSGHEWYSRAQDLYNNRRFERAGQAYENAAQRGYRRDTALYNAGCSYALADQQGRAIDALRAAFEEGFDRPDLFAEDSDLNSLRGDPRFKKLLDDVMGSGTAEASRRAATRDYDRLTKQKDVDDGDWNSVGIDLLRSGDYEAAANAFDKEFQVSKDEDALYNKACARSLAGKKEDALKLLEQSITTGSVDADHMQEDPDLIALHEEARFDQLVTLADDLELHDGSWWNGNGNWSWKGNDEKRWKKAIPHFEEITRKHPKVGRAWSNLGYAQLAAEDAKSGTVSFQKALDLGYRPGATMYNLACASAQAGNTDVAISWLEKSEGTGFEMWNYARWDDDLDPLRDDARYKAMAKRWKAEYKAKHDDDDDDEDWDWDDDHDKDHDDDDETN